MILATNIKSVKGFGFKLILDDSKFVVGVNLLCNKKILIKKRFKEARFITNQNEEIDIVNQVILECFNKDNDNLTKTKGNSK